MSSEGPDIFDVLISEFEEVSGFKLFTISRVKLEEFESELSSKFVYFS